LLLNLEHSAADTSHVTNANLPFDHLRSVPVADPGEVPVSIEPFRIAVLCTGNRFRSPIAAAVIETLAENLPVEVRSMGTQHTGSRGATSSAIDAATRLGVDLSAHRARLATALDVAHADLVLGFELVHLARARQLGAPISRMFTLPSLGEVVEQLPPERVNGERPTDRARRVVTWAHQHRDAAGTALREIRDPVAAGPSRSLSTAREVHHYASIVAAYLFGGALRGARNE
jgi:protein-tyrosine phosphatase